MPGLPIAGAQPGFTSMEQLEMPILRNARHEKFVQSLIQGMSQVDAYRVAGYSVSSASGAYAHAARLVRNGRVRARLNELQSKAEIKSLLTMEQHMAELRELRDLAKADSQWAAAIKAEELRGKLRGFYVEKLEHAGAHAFDEMSTAELRVFVAAEMKALGLIPSPIRRHEK